MRCSLPMTGLQIALLVAAILGAQFLAFVVLWRWIGRRARALLETVRHELRGSGDTLEVEPEVAHYAGGSGNHPRVKGLGVLALTDRRLVFRKLFGRGVEIARSDIADVRDGKWFRRSYSSGRQHVVLVLDDGSEVGFVVNDHGAWMERVRAIAKKTQPAS